MRGLIVHSIVGVVGPSPALRAGEPGAVRMHGNFAPGRHGGRRPCARFRTSLGPRQETSATGHASAVTGLAGTAAYYACRATALVFGLGRAAAFVS